MSFLHRKRSGSASNSVKITSDALSAARDTRSRSISVGGTSNADSNVTPAANATPARRGRTNSISKHIRRISGGHALHNSHDGEKPADPTSQASMKELHALPGYEAHLLPTLKDTIERMTMEKPAKKKDQTDSHAPHAQYHDPKETIGKRISMGFAGVGAGAVNLARMAESEGVTRRGNAGLGVGSVGMASGSKLVERSAINDSAGNGGKLLNPWCPRRYNHQLTSLLIKVQVLLPTRHR